MSYGNPNRRTYVFPNVDFGAGDSAHSLRGPNGKEGKLIDIHLSATETFNSVTTDANVQVGISGGDLDAYALFVPGDLAATDAISAQNGADSDWLLDANIPADTAVEVTCIAPTGGTPAGIATVTVVIDWAD